MNRSQDTILLAMRMLRHDCPTPSVARSLGGVLRELRAASRSLSLGNGCLHPCDVEIQESQHAAGITADRIDLLLREQDPACFEGHRGFEPLSSLWKSEVLGLYTNVPKPDSRLIVP